MKKLSILGILILLTFSIQTVSASSYPDGCTATTKYSATTGHLCAAPRDCAPGDLFSAQTGKPCTASTGYISGCTSLLGFSVTTGSKCDGSVPAPQLVVVQPQPSAQQSVTQQVQQQSAPSPVSVPATVQQPQPSPVVVSLSIRKRQVYDNGGNDVSTYIVETTNSVGATNLYAIVSSPDGAIQVAGQAAKQYSVAAPTGIVQ